jgi:DNA-cytosine methyltransferase
VLTCGSIFSGIGGFDLGFERTGHMRTLWFCEQNAYCRRVLARHWPGVPCHPDVRALVADTDQRERGQTPLRRDGGTATPDSGGSRHELLPVPVPYVDVLCGGFPCQDLSYAGKGAGIDGERSGLWSEYARLVRELRPRYVVVENVPALLGRGLGRVLGDLAACGYDAEWDCLPASAFGAPHRRDRVWVVAYAGGEQRHGRADMGRARSGVLDRREAKADYEERHECEPGLGEVRADAADSKPPRLQGRTGSGSTGAGRSSVEPSSVRQGIGGQWLPEPDVRLLADGVSEGLGGRVDGHRIHADEARRQAARLGVRVLRGDHESARAPRQRRSDEQLARELADALRPLPHVVALGEWEGAVAPALAYVRGVRQACEALGVVRNASDSLAEAWLALSAEDQGWIDLAVDGGQWSAEWPGVGRVAHGIPNRVDRLAALGNALVPAIAQWIGERILEYEEGRLVA